MMSINNLIHFQDNGAIYVIVRAIAGSATGSPRFACTVAAQVFFSAASTLRGLFFLFKLHHSHHPVQGFQSHAS